MVLLYFAIAFFGGVTIVVSRILNSKLGQEMGSLPGVFFNFLSGLIVSFILLFVFDFKEVQNIDFTKFTGFPWYYYLGGLFGLAVTFLSNLYVPKLSAFYFSLFMFTGNVVSSMVLDYFIKDDLSIGKVVGCLLVIFGLVLSLLADREKIPDEVTL